ncbi:M66 family metalloprotease [Nannocystaceae bacterium ST9]
MRRTTLNLGLAVSFGLSAIACNDDATGDSNDALGETAGDGDGDGDGETGSGTGDGDGDGDGDSSTTSSGDGDGDGDTTGVDPSACGDGQGPEFTPFEQADWARGDIRIARIEVNQGTAIPIVLDGQLIPVEDRAGGLVKDRNTLVQVFWSVPGNWQARPITAKLHVRNGDGDLDVIEVTKTISGSPSSGSLDGPITFQVPAAAFVGNLEFYVELWEGEGGHEGIPASSQAPAAPNGGMQPIGVTCEPMEAKIVMVPVEYDYGNCHTDTTSTLQTYVQEFGDHFFAQNPIHTLHIEVRPEKIVRDTQVTMLQQINTELVALRFADFAEPNEYYFALLDACTGGIDDAGGLSPGTPGPLKGLGDLRVSTGLLVGVDWSKNTFVHELGHNQGRPHSPCGDPDGPDPNYPHDGASIGVYGFNILTGQFFGPSNHKDYMSYCDPVWVSDWTWGWVHEQVRQLTSWDYAGQSAPGFGEILHGWVHPSGEQAWWTSPGELPDDMLTTAESVAFYDEQGELIDMRPAASWTLDDGKTRYFMAEVPDSDLELVAEVVRVSKDVESSVPRQAITRYF